MILKPAEKRVRVVFAGITITDSTEAVVLHEILPVLSRVVEVHAQLADRDLLFCMNRPLGISRFPCHA